MAAKSDEQQECNYAASHAIYLTTASSCIHTTTPARAALRDRLFLAGDRSDRRLGSQPHTEDLAQSGIRHPLQLADVHPGYMTGL